MRAPTTALLLAFLVLIGLSAQGSKADPTNVPKLINYQGRLTMAEGETAPANGNYAIEFRIFDAPTAGALVWGSRYESVPVHGGQFNVVLGSGGTALDGESPAVNDIGFAFSEANRYVEIAFADGPDNLPKQTLAPRQQILSAPFALTALHGVPAGTVVPFAGKNIPPGWIPCDDRVLDASDPQYAALAKALDNEFDRGDEPAGHFRVPDLRGRTAIGTGAGDTRGPDDPQPATNYLLGMKFGTERHKMTLDEMPRHNHNVRDLGHAHSTAMRYGGWGSTDGFRGWYGTYGGQVATTTGHANIAQENRGNDQPHNNMQPSLALNYIIKL
jgi:microcystin-dependent protein